MQQKVQYQWEKFLLDDKPQKSLDAYKPSFGPVVLERNPDGTAKSVRFQVLIDNPSSEVYLIGKFNEWGQDAMGVADLQFEMDEHQLMGTLTTDAVKHGDPYKLYVRQDGKLYYMQDPAAPFFDKEGNSIFHDFEDPSAYKMNFPFIDTHHRSTRVMQTDLPGLIAHWSDKDGRLGKDVPEHEYYRFISLSGVIEMVKSLGFNTIQFLPFAQSIDGPNWKYRYLIPFQFAVQNRWGSPDEFARMIDTFHKHDIAVIGDFVIGHAPHKDFKVFGYDASENGIHIWKNRHGTPLYLKEETSWGTMRWDNDNHKVRRFLIESCLHFMKHYRIDGFRIDNVDGIIRYGENGEGEERPNGRVFLRELNQELYDYNPQALIHYEAHYFHEDNAKMLVVPMEDDQRALGATAYNSSRITYYMHREYMPKDAKKISPWRFRDITEEKEWGQSNSTIADFHNHDAAAGLMDMRCTGSYAYDTMTIKQPHNHSHALGKIKAMEAVISFITEGRTLDLVQTFLLQNGTFEHDTSIHWHLTFIEVSKNTLAYKAAVNKLMDDPAFWPMFVCNRKILNVDDVNKIIVIERSADYNGKSSRFIIVINLSAWVHHNYQVGVDVDTPYKVVLNSDRFAYAGLGMTAYPDELHPVATDQFELLNKAVVLDKIAPYGVVVLESVLRNDKAGEE